MKRLTARKEGTAWSASQWIQAGEEGYTGEAIERLAKFEDICQMLEEQQEKISAELEQLRQAGKVKSHKFNELLGKKLTNGYFLSLLKTHGIE